MMCSLLNSAVTGVSCVCCVARLCCLINSFLFWFNPFSFYCTTTSDTVNFARWSSINGSVETKIGGHSQEFFAYGSKHTGHFHREPSSKAVQSGLPLRQNFRPDLTGYGAFTHTLLWEGMGWAALVTQCISTEAFTHWVTNQPILSHPIPACM